MQNLVWIAAAGGLGALARYGLGGLVHRLWGPSFPWGTFVVNVLGCFFFGLVWALAESRFALSAQARLIALTGFMGAFTTFSTFIFETEALLRDGQWLWALGNFLGQNLLGLAALVLGLALARIL